MTIRSKNNQIAQNTTFLYMRMLFNMVVSLFTSRVVLLSLGVEDFGIFQIVGGTTTMLSFLNSALATGSERFLTFELGIGDFKKLKKTFSTVFSAHIILAIFVIIALETFGLWFLYYKLSIAPERMAAAIFSFHACVLSSAFTIIQIPYNASIISHEKMSAFAYISILEVSMKLGIAYLIYISPWDKLKVYSILYCAVQILTTICYSVYCIIKFEETHYSFNVDKGIMNKILSYSCWNLLDNFSSVLSNQGAVLLLGVFFNPSVVAARAVANQVNMATHQFLNNFRKAFTPQVVKRFAAEDFEESKSLLLSSTKYSYYLMLCLCFPICMTSYQLLDLWLDIVPEYANFFLQFAVCTSLFHVFNASFYTPLYAKGDIRTNAIYSLLITGLFLPITFILFKLGLSPVIISVVQMGLTAIISLLVKPILLIKLVNYSWKDILDVYLPCIKVTCAAITFPLIYKFYFEDLLITSDILQFIIMAAVSVSSVLFAIWYFGLTPQVKVKLRGTVSSLFISK